MKYYAKLGDIYAPRYHYMFCWSSENTRWPEEERSHEERLYVGDYVKRGYPEVLGLTAEEYELSIPHLPPVPRQWRLGEPVLVDPRIPFSSVFGREGVVPVCEMVIPGRSRGDACAEVPGLLSEPAAPFWEDTYQIPTEPYWLWANHDCWNRREVVLDPSGHIFADQPLDEYLAELRSWRYERPMTAFEGAFWLSEGVTCDWNDIFEDQELDCYYAFAASRFRLQGADYIVALYPPFRVLLVPVSAVPEWIWHCSCGDWTKVAPSESGATVEE
jgi:hypothetical protein